MEQNVSRRFVGKFLFNYCVRVHDITFHCCVFQINRLEGQVSRYKASADNSEKIEDELKAEKRKLQREVKTRKRSFIDYEIIGVKYFCSVVMQLRTALDKIEEMEMTNNHLVKRLEKMKANRNALLSQQ